MGKPRLILLVRHAQSEGNKNRDIHQYVPDHRVKLTADGQLQAEEAGRRLRSLLREDDTIQVFTSPYRRTRETTAGMLKTLTAECPEAGPSPFKRENIKVYEEPRLREQDFGNFQPCSIEMERMWQERADYGHFFYRIPNGESAADAYDRISGFNESLWRQFGDDDFPSVCVLVTHGLMTRVFLMKWYHWSVEYFEDLRNINHCEFVVMKQENNGKYALQTELRTWTEFQARAAATNTAKVEASPVLTTRRWGGCAMGCNHQHMSFPRRTKRLNTMDIIPQLPKPAMEEDEKDDHPIASQEADHANGSHTPAKKSSRKIGTNGVSRRPDPPHSDSDTDDGRVSPTDGHGIHGGSSADDEGVSESFVTVSSTQRISTHQYRGPGTGSGGEISDESDFFDTNVHQLESRMTFRSEMSRAALAQIEEGDERGSTRRRSSPTSPRRQGSDARYRKASIKGWTKESGMTGDKKANALGDVSDDDKGKVEAEEVEPKEGTAAADIY